MLNITYHNSYFEIEKLLQLPDNIFDYVKQICAYRVSDRILQGDNPGRSKPPTGLDLDCFTTLPGQQVAEVVTHQLLELLVLSLS